MTDKEIDYRRHVINSVAQDRAAEINDGRRAIYSDNELNELDELSCRSMMSSIYCYHGIPTLFNEEGYTFGEYLRNYLKHFGRKRFNQIRDEQVADYNKCTISYNVYTDDEGCTYNSINWHAA